MDESPGGLRDLIEKSNIELGLILERMILSEGGGFSTLRCLLSRWVALHRKTPSPSVSIPPPPPPSPGGRAAGGGTKLQKLVELAAGNPTSKLVANASCSILCPWSGTSPSEQTTLGQPVHLTFCSIWARPLPRSSQHRSDYRSTVCPSPFFPLPESGIRISYFDGSACQLCTHFSFSFPSIDTATYQFDPKSQDQKRNARIPQPGVRNPTRSHYIPVNYQPRHSLWCKQPCSEKRKPSNSSAAPHC